MKKISTSGFTLMEILVAISILAMIALIVFPSISSFRKNQALKNAIEETVSLLERARSKTLASENDRAYGVLIDTTAKTISLFRIVSGSNVTEETVSLDTSLSISHLLNPGPSGSPDISFARLSGEASRTGTVTFTNGDGVVRTITITKIGNVSAN